MSQTVYLCPSHHVDISIHDHGPGWHAGKWSQTSSVKFLMIYITIIQNRSTVPYMWIYYHEKHTVHDVVIHYSTHSFKNSSTHDKKGSHDTLSLLSALTFVKLLISIKKLTYLESVILINLLHRETKVEASKKQTHFTLNTCKKQKCL